MKASKMIEEINNTEYDYMKDCIDKGHAKDAEKAEEAIKTRIQVLPIVKQQEQLMEELAESVARHIKEWFPEGCDCMKCKDDHKTCQRVGKNCDVLRDKATLQKYKQWNEE
jgi:hypothetical protein